MATVLLAMGDSWGSVMFLGVASIVLGVLVMVWPGATLGVVAILVALQILLFGVYCVAHAITAEDGEGGGRVLAAVMGVVALIVGVLALRDLTHTVVALATLLGLFWIAVGVITVMSAFFGRARPGRGLTVLSGFLAIAAGIVVLVYPSPSLVVLTVIFGCWLVVFGVLTAGVAWQMRRVGRGDGRTPNQHAVATG